MITISNLSKAFGGRTLFDNVSLQLNTGRRYGLVGANGSGKSTFLKILAGSEPASGGSISYPKGAALGVLSQDRAFPDDPPIVEAAMRGDPETYDALKELETAEDGRVSADRVHALQERITAKQGYTLEARASSILAGLGIEAAVQNRAISTLSGGYQLRVLLAQVLVAQPDVLLLDEPTNHLDIISIRWLEGFLADFTGCAVVISHDQHFLNRFASDILDVDYEAVTHYVGNYAAFTAAKVQTREQQERQIERNRKLVEQKQAFIDKFRAKATKARQAQSRVKQIERIQIDELAQSSRRSPSFGMPIKRPSGRDVLKTEQLCKAYGSHVVLQDVSLELRRGERLAVIGANGLGKSTLLKILAHQLSPDSGEISWGHETHVGYFAQDHHEVLTDDAKTALDFVWDACPTEGVGYVRGQLGRMLFSGDDVSRPVGALSGGESARLIFARLAVEKPNVLLLDEPTNHLDLEAIAALAEALKSYEGTLLFVSHDRWFVTALATRIVDIRKDGIVDFPGSYAEYLARSGHDYLDAAAHLGKRKSAKSGKVDREERKRLANRRKGLPQRRDRVLAEIEQLEAKKAQLEAHFEDPAFVANPGKVSETHDELSRVEAELRERMGEWERLELEIGQLESAES